MTERPEADTGMAAPTRSSSRPGRRSAMSDHDLAILRTLADRIDPGDAGAHNNLGVVFYQKGLVEEALEAFEHALELDPRLAVARRNAEVAVRESGHYEDRVRRLREAVQQEPDSVDARDALARTYLLGGDPEGAAREWRTLLRDRPDSTPLHMKLAYAEAERGRVKEAIQLLEQAARLSPDLPAVRLQLGELLLDIDMPVRAEREVRRALALDAGMARAHAFLGRLLEETGREEEAEEARERARQLAPDMLDTEGHLSLERYRSATEARATRTARPGSVRDAALGGVARAAELRRAGDLEGALAQLEALAEEGDDSWEVRQALAEVRLLRNDPGAAAELYTGLVKEREDSPKLWNEHGVALHRLGRFDEAVQAYRRTVALDHGYALGWNNLGVALAQRGEAGPAERALRKAAADQATPELLWNLGLFLSLTDRADEAVEVYQAALDADDTVAESWSRLGTALFQAQRSAEARDALLEALDRDADHAGARYQLGFALSALGDFRGALRETQRALEQAPILPTPRYQLLIDAQFEAGTLPAPDSDAGQQVRAGSPVTDFEFDQAALDAAFEGIAPPAAEEPGDDLPQTLDEARTALRRGQLGRARDAVGRAVARAPGAIEPRLLEAEVLLRQGLAGEALERFEAVLEGAGDEEAIRTAAAGRARALLGLERPVEAVDAAAAAQAHGGPVSLLGRSLFAAGRTEEAVEAFERAVAQDEDDGPTLSGLGGALLAAGRPADAERVYRRALESAPSALARVGLARALEALGDGDGAVAAYEEAVDMLPSYGPAVLGLAAARWRAGEGQEAVRLLVELLALDPTHVEALVRLGTWLGELGRRDQAVRALRRALGLAPEHAEAARELERLMAVEAGG